MAGENTESLIATRETEWLRRVQWPPYSRGGQLLFRLRSEVRFLSCPFLSGGALAGRRWKANAGRLRRRRRGQSVGGQNLARWSEKAPEAGVCKSRRNETPGPPAPSISMLGERS